MRVSPVLLSPPQTYVLGNVNKPKKIEFSLKSLEVHAEKLKPYGFTKINLSISSAKIETKNFVVKMVDISLEKTSVSLWRRSTNDYALSNFISKEFEWMAGYVSREAGIDEKAALDLFKDVLDKFPKGFDISEDYIANALRKLNPSLDPKKAREIAKDIKIFLESLINIMKLHRKSAEKSGVIEILKMSLRSYTFVEKSDQVKSEIEELA